MMTKSNAAFLTLVFTPLYCIFNLESLYRYQNKALDKLLAHNNHLHLCPTCLWPA